MTPQKNRIWELDALRGICILGMMVVHFVFDLNEFAGLGLTMPGCFNFCQRYGHILFILISGICATLASRSFRRGMIVFGAGLLVTGVTLFMVCVLKFNRSLSIFFGILHLLGLCMILFPLFKKLPVWALAVLGAGFVALGVWLAALEPVAVSFPSAQGLLLGAIGIRPAGFYSGDYFPIFPNLGWFLLGAVLGRTAYRRRESLLPKVNADFFLLRFFRFCGRHSLWIYLLHQPVLAGLTMLLAAFF
jgi:uncharacterized membrane protein